MATTGDDLGHAYAQTLYGRYYANVYRYALSQLRSPEDAEDAAQNTFLRAFAALQKGVVPESEVAWLFKIAHNVCASSKLAWLRRRRVELPRDLDELQVARPESDVDISGLDDALAAMPPRLREAFLLREWQGLSYAEIAEQLDTSRSAVETLIFRARRHLAAELRKAQNALTLGPLATWLRGLFGTSAAVRGAGVLALATGVVAATTVATTPAKQAPARARPQHHGARADIAPVLAAQLPQGRASVVRKRVGGAAAPAAPESAVPGLAPTGTGGATNGSTAATAPSAPTTTAAGLPSLPAAAPPAVTVPAVTAPAVTAPAVTTPTVTVPGVTVPPLTTPVVTTPSVTTPTVTVSSPLP